MGMSRGGASGKQGLIACSSKRFTDELWSLEERERERERGKETERERERKRGSEVAKSSENITEPERLV